ILTALAAASATATPTSRAGLAKRTRLTKPTVSKLVEELVGADLVAEGDPIAAGAGRPMVPLTPAHGTLLAIGLEIAADHVACLGIDLAGTVLGHRIEYLKVTSTSAEAAIDLAAALVGQLRAGAGERPEVAVGAAVPGRIAPELVAQGRDEAGELPVVAVVAAVPGRIAPDDGRVLSAPNLDWTEVPLVTRLHAHPQLAGLSVRAQNDNRLSVLTEIDHRPGESF